LSETILNPGDGNSFTDNSGNIYILTGNDVAVENGSPIPGGYGTAQMAFSNGTVYGQDNTSGNWFTWNQQNWNSSSPPSGAGGSVATPSSSPIPVTTPIPTASLASSDAIPIATPGNGSFTDGSGNVFNINPVNDTAQINGQPITPNDGSTLTSVLAYDQGNVYAQDIRNGTWYEMQSKGSPGLYEWQPVTPPDVATIQQQLG
jgi:hypothetical protein